MVASHPTICMVQSAQSTNNEEILKIYELQKQITSRLNQSPTYKQIKNLAL